MTKDQPIDSLIANIDISDSDEDDKLFKRVRSSDIPAEFSIDNLLRARNKESYFPRSNSTRLDQVKKEEEEKEEKAFIPPIELTTYVPKDGCIFIPVTNPFPLYVFDVLHINAFEIKSPIDLPSYVRIMFELYPDQISPNPDIFFAYAHYLVTNNISDENNSLFKYSQQLEPHSLNFELWRDYFVYAIKNSMSSVFPLFSVCNFFLFKFGEEGNITRARIDVYLCYYSLLFCTEFINHRFFSVALHQMRSCLIDDDSKQNDVDFLVSQMYEIALENPIEMISSVVSYFPIDGIGATLINTFSIKLIYHYFDLEDPDADFENLAEEFYRIKYLCDSDSEQDLKKASAVLALSERVLLSAYRITNVSGATISKMIHALRFSLRNSDPGMLTLLKEQIHFTRTQFETLIQSDFNSTPSSQALPF